MVLEKRASSADQSSGLPFSVANFVARVPRCRHKWLADKRVRKFLTTDIQKRNSSQSYLSQSPHGGSPVSKLRVTFGTKCLVQVALNSERRLFYISSCTFFSRLLHFPTDRAGTYLLYLLNLVLCTTAKKLSQLFGDLFNFYCDVYSLYFMAGWHLPTSSIASLCFLQASRFRRHVGSTSCFFRSWYVNFFYKRYHYCNLCFSSLCKSD